MAFYDHISNYAYNILLDSQKTDDSYYGRNLKGRRFCCSSKLNRGCNEMK